MVRLISIALHENWRAGCFVERLRRMSYTADEIQAWLFGSFGSRATQSVTCMSLEAASDSIPPSLQGRLNMMGS